MKLVLFPPYGRAKKNKGLQQHIEGCQWHIGQNCLLTSSSGRNSRWIVYVQACSLPPDTRTKLTQALQNSQLLVPQGNYCIQDALHDLHCSLQHSNGLRTCPNFAQKTIQHVVGGIEWSKRYLAPSFMLLLQGVYEHLAHRKPYPLCYIKTKSPSKNPDFYQFHCFSRMGPILHCPGGLRYASFPAKVAIYCRRVLDCHPLPV